MATVASPFLDRSPRSSPLVRTLSQTHMYPKTTGPINAASATVDSARTSVNPSHFGSASKTIACPECGHPFSRDAEVRRHVLERHRCPHEDCAKVKFTSSKTRDDHQRIIHHGCLGHRCGKCLLEGEPPNTLPRIDKLKEHYRKAHNLKPTFEPIKCEHQACLPSKNFGGGFFESSMALQQHDRRAHKGLTKNSALGSLIPDLSDSTMQVTVELQNKASSTTALSASASHQEESVSPQSKIFALDVDEDANLIKMWNDHVLDHFPTIVREADICSTYSVSLLRRRSKSVCAIYMPREDVPIVSFSQGTPVRLVDDDADAAWLDELLPDGKFPHERRYYPKLAMGVSVGIQGCKHVSATSGGFVKVEGRIYMLTVEHLFGACSCLGTFEVQSPSISDANHVQRQSTKKLCELMLRIQQACPDEIPLEQAPERLFPAQIDEEIEQYTRILTESEDNDENLRKYAFGRVRERSGLGQPAQRRSINPRSGGKAHLMDWSLIEVTAKHRQGNNVHRYGRNAEPTIHDLCMERTHPKGCVNPALMQFQDENGAITYEWSLIVPECERLRDIVFKGDSGAWIISDDDKLLGQLWGWDNGYLLFTPIVDIFADIAQTLNKSIDVISLPKVQTPTTSNLLGRTVTDSPPAVLEETHSFEMEKHLDPALESSPLSPVTTPTNGRRSTHHPDAHGPKNYGSSTEKHDDEEQISETESSVTGKTYSTRPTTMSDPRSLKRITGQPTIIEQLVEEPMDDGQFTVSDYSEVHITAEQSKLIIETLTRLLLEDLSENLVLAHSQPLRSDTFLELVELSIRSYAVKVMKDNAKRSRTRTVSIAIRRLRNEIALRIQIALIDPNEFEYEQRPLPSIVREMSGIEQTSEEKCSNWDGGNVTDYIPDNELPSNPPEGYTMDNELPSNPPEDWQNRAGGSDASVSGVPPEYEDIYTYLVGHEAFPTLKEDLKKGVEQHFGDQMGLIRLRILRALEHHPSSTFGIAHEQYPTGHLQTIRHVLTLTGNSEDAELTTVEHYLHQTWPRYSYELVDHITYIVSRGIEGRPCPFIEYHPEQRIFLVCGDEDRIVAVAQQLAWLGAACCAPSGQLAVCYTTISQLDNNGEASRLDYRKESYPLLDITYDVSSSGIESSNSCWHDLVGDSMIAHGFPIRKRVHGEIGLLLSMELMAVLAKIPFATCYRNGYVFKGRSFILEPVERRETSVQWHLFQKQGKTRVRYEDLAELCPKRLMLDTYDETDLLSAECFLGWCPQCDINLATEGYNYRSIQYSKAGPLSKSTISLTSFSVGFQQWGAASLNYTIRNNQGYYRNAMAEFYLDLLDDAAQIDVVLQDMEDRRAWHTNAETMILHMILHRHDCGRLRGNNNTTLMLVKADADDPSSVRSAMLSNADTIIGPDQHLKDTNVTNKSFIDLVKELYTVLEALQATQEDLEKEAGFEVTLDRGYRVSGWEYRSLVDRQLHPKPGRTKLARTCGEWPKLMRELGAVVLFGDCFQDVFRPRIDSDLCCALKTLPKGKDLLAMQAATLQELYDKSGSWACDDNMARITRAGTKLHPSKHLFDSCPITGGHNCTCERIQQLDFSNNSKKVTKLSGLTNTGAIIIGTKDALKVKWKLFSKRDSTPTVTSAPLTHPQLQLQPLLVPTAQPLPPTQNLPNPLPSQPIP
ncbi:hypothetical protein BU23DRAFT_569422 [Bimuria novae-zelandiae CBS 107.79]|uniref:C2H2-type domain-containing protein n=1 Tax=Bimuria novae-zelandiae CBS 107.79 TaxID=1447943 RepID=A0A6A5V7B1_9PLEO|nr:hypothetical protein BU23DRAFT_569422 [Bimuria novae-zelandiae CBS 107.79]